MKSLKLRLERDAYNKQFPHQNRASTDAIGAVVNWADPTKGREYETCKDEDEVLEVIVTYQDHDKSAEDELVARCRKRGIDCFAVRE